MNANQAAYKCALDELATYKNEIGSSSQYVLRSSHSFDGWICDGKYPAKAKMSAVFKSLGNISATFNPIQAAGCYVVGIKNGQATGGVAYYAMTTSQFQALVTYMYGDSWFTATDISVALQKVISEPMDFIASVQWYPFDFSGTPTQIYFGFFTATGCTGTRIYESQRVMSATDFITLDQHPQVSRGQYLNGAPYTKIMIDCFSFGQIPIDPMFFILNHIMGVTVRLDLYTGLGEIAITGDGGRFAKQQAQMGVSIQLSQVTQDLVKPFFNAIASASALATGNYVGAMAAFVNGLASSLPQIQSSGAAGSKVAYELDPQVSIQYMEIVDEDNATIGRPLAQVRQISTLAGYLECENVDIDIVGTKAEKNAIINYMQGGFFYE